MFSSPIPQQHGLLRVGKRDPFLRFEVMVLTTKDGSLVALDVSLFFFGCDFGSVQRYIYFFKESTKTCQKTHTQMSGS